MVKTTQKSDLWSAIFSVIVYNWNYLAVFSLSLSFIKILIRFCSQISEVSFQRLSSSKRQKVARTLKHRRLLRYPSYACISSLHDIFLTALVSTYNWNCRNAINYLDINHLLLLGVQSSTRIEFKKDNISIFNNIIFALLMVLPICLQCKTK